MIDNSKSVDCEEKAKAAVLRVEATDEKVIARDQSHQDMLEPERIDLHN